MRAGTVFLTRAGWARVVLLAALVLASLALLRPAGAHASGCTNSWTAGKSGSWFTPGNWSKGKVPAEGEEVCITEAGTYTVEQNQSAEVPSLKSLTLGAAGGTQTLQVGSTCSRNAGLTTTAGLSIGAQGAVTMTNGDGCGDSVTISGPVTNAGSLTAIAANGGSRTLSGSLTNTGTLQVNAALSFNGSKAALKNEGSINVAENEALTLTSEASLANLAGGSINGTGNGVVLLGGGTSFEQGAGKTTGTQPVRIEDAKLSYTGSGESIVALRGASTVTGKSVAGQTLRLQSSGAKNASITAESFTNGGAIVMMNGDTSGNNVTLTAATPLTSSGSLTTETNAGGSRTLSGTFVNTGTINIGAPTTLNGASSLLTNKGTLNLANGETLSVAGTKGVENESGTIAATGTGTLVQTGGGTFVEGAGTTSGTQPVVVEDGAVSYTGSGASTIALRGTSTLSGSLASGQALNLQSTCSKNTGVTIGASLTNAGTITMTNGDSCGDTVTLAVTSPAVLTNSGTLSVEKANGGSRTINGKLTNTGSFDVNTATGMTGSGTLLKNKGAVNIAGGISLVLSSSASAENEAGTITGTGSGALVMTAGGAFTQGAGKTAGTLPVILEDIALTYSGSGESTIALRGAGSLTGSTAAGQTLLLQSTCSKNTVISVGASLTNAGAIVMTNGDSCGDSVTVNVAGGQVLTNSGSIAIEKANGGSRTITGSLTNSGTIADNANAAYGSSGAVLLLNGGSLKLAEGVTLTVSGPSTVTNEGGVISGTGSGQLVMHGGTFDQGNGKTEGALPVVVEDGALAFTGKGAGTVALRGSGSLTGPVNKGQTASLQSTCSKNTTVSTAAFVNSGTIVLTNGDSCGDSVTLSVAEAGTITNKGTIKIERANGGGRAIEGSILNEKQLTVAAGQTLTVKGTYSQSKKGTYSTGVSEAGAGLMAVTGTAKVEGSLGIVQAKGFTAKEGQKYSVLTSSALTGTFSKLKGNKIKKTKPPLKYNASYSATGVTLEVGP